MSGDREVAGPQPEQPHRRRPHRVRLPGFLAEDDVGAGEVIKRVTSAAGIRPCGGCARRAAALDNWLTFTSRRS